MTNQVGDNEKFGDKLLIVLVEVALTYMKV